MKNKKTLLIFFIIFIAILLIVLTGEKKEKIQSYVMREHTEDEINIIHLCSNNNQYVIIINRNHEEVFKTAMGCGREK